MVLQLEQNAGERPTAVGNEHKDGKDRKGVRMDCGSTVLLIVHTEQKTDNVFHLFIFYFLSSKTNSYLLCKAVEFTYLHRFAAYITFNKFSIPCLRVHIPF